VDFEFKVKSSAMKILTANTDLVLIRFAYYLMQSIEIDHDNHQRYWISVFSKQEVALPPLAEQKRIVEMIDYLYSLLDNMII
jgi:type I restriction enzyme S subunit